MIKNDYILRIIEQISIVIAQIIGLRSIKKFEESQQILNGAFIQFLGLSLQSVSILSHKDLISVISGSDGIDEGKCIVLAELLKQQADLYEAQDNHNHSFAMYLKSLKVFVEVFIMNNDLCTEQYIAEIDDIISIVILYDIPDDSKYLIFEFYDLIGRFDKAEDILFELLWSHNFDNSLVDKGIAFYERLMDKDHQMLMKGNLPIDEIVDGLNKLHEHKK